MSRGRVALLLGAGFAVAVALGVLTGPGGFPDELLLRLRLLRVAQGLAAGLLLAVAGCIFQAVLQNVLAEPYVLGVSSGAALGAALSIALGLAPFSWGIPGCAFAGGAASFLLVLAVARGMGGTALILAGVVVGSVLSSGLLLVLSLSTAEGLRNMTWWMLGNLDVFDPRPLVVLWGVVVVVFGGACLLSRELDALSLGEERAAGVGVEVGLMRFVLLGLGTLAAAATVSAAGIIPFVGLFVPHMVRGLTGPRHARLVPASAVAGAGVLVAADALARLALAPRQVPVGVVTALVGGPLFLVLLRGRTRPWS